MDLTWPVVGLILGLVVIVVFRKSFERFLARTKKIGPGGFEASEERQDQLTAKVNPADVLIMSMNSPLITETEVLVRKDFEKRGIVSAEDRERALFRLAAGLGCLYQFESLHNKIWASQLTALRFVNTREDGVEVSELRSFYDNAKDSFPAWYENYTFEQWLGFLESSLLLANKGARKVISVRGREYLKFIIEQGRKSPMYG